MAKNSGWKLDRTNSRLDFYYNGTRIGHIDAGGIDLATGLTFQVNDVNVTASTLDAAYNGGTEIAVDSAAVTLTGTHASNNVLAVTANSSGNAIDLTQAGSGKDIDGTSSTWSVTKTGAATFASLVAPSLVSGSTGNVNLAIDGYGSGTIVLAATSTGAITLTRATTLSAGATITTGGLTVTAGGLTVSAGTTTSITSTNIALVGAVAITGNTAITGNLTVSGTMDWGSSLTVDELILDTDGAVISTSSCGLWRDNSGDASLQAIASKDVRLVIAGVTEMQVSDSNAIINEAGGDRNFRVESDNLQYALYVDGGKDSVVVGDNVDISDVDYRLMVGNVAKTLSANQSAALLYVSPSAATTEAGTGTHTYIATAYFAEPNITGAGATTTVAATVYINNAPDEASANYALYVASGGVGVAAGAVSLEGGAFTFNTAKADLNFTVASDNLAYALYVDAGNDCVVIGDNTDISDVDYRLRVGQVAKTLATNQSAAILSVTATAATTEAGSGTHGYIASAYFSEPDITGAAATTTVAATVYINNAPTEGSTNAALYIGTGDIVIGSGGVTLTSGNLTLTAASDIIVPAATAVALELSDATTKFYALDTRVATASATTHTWNISAYTIASGATNVETGWSFAAHTLNYTGNTQVTTQVDTIVLGARTIAGDTATLTVDEANTLMAVAPTEGTNIAITAASAMRVINAGGTPVNQYGLYIEDLTVGATTDVGIYLAGADSAAIYVAADPIHVADNVRMGFGTGTGVGAYDASIYYDATNLVINPKVIGSGVLTLSGGMTLGAGLSLKSDGAAEIGICVSNDAAFAVGSEGSLEVPFLASTGAAFSDAIGGATDGCIGINQDTDNANLGTLEARVNGSWVSVALAGIEIQGKTMGSRKNPSNKWHDNQIVGDGFVDETVCSICGKKMKVGEPIVLYPNFTRTDKQDGSTSLHCVFAHLECAK